MRNARKVLAVLGGSLALVAVPTVAQAATINVTDGGDGPAGCTLRNAIESADTNASVGTCTAGDGNDIVAVPASVGPAINLGSQLDAGGMGTLTVNGPGAGILTVNGGANYRVLRVNGAVAVTNVTLANGHATTDGIGGGVFLQSGSLGLDHVVVTGNSANQDLASGFSGVFGGGIYADGPLALVDSTVSTNAAFATVNGAAPGDAASASGGGIFATGSSAVSISRSTITGNGAAAAAPPGSDGSLAAGGGVFVGNGGANTLGVASSTVSENAVQAFGQPAGSPAGGGIFTLAAGGTTLVSDTLTENGAVSGANLAGTSTTVANTLVTAPTGGANCDAAKTSAGFNLEDSPTLMSTCGFTLPTDKVVAPAGTGLDPDLASNGGPTQTHALLDVSPATDAGNGFTSTTDQRGFTRPVDFPGLPNAVGGDGSDIGAFELQQACSGQTVPGGPCGVAMQTSPSTLNFGDIPVGGSSVAQTVSVSNVAGAGDVTLGQVTIGGNDQGHFVKSSDGCSGGTLPPGGSCQIAVTFSPLSAGAKVATLTVTGSDPTNPSDAVTLRGNGVAPLSVTTPPATSTGPTGQRAAARKRCNKKFPKKAAEKSPKTAKKRKKCLKKALPLPV